MALRPELGETGRPTPVTTFLAVHHGLRRDARRYAPAVAGGAGIDQLARHWAQYRAILAFHHRQEEELMFPLLLAQDPGLAPIIARLDADHAGLDDLLADLDEAFAAQSAEAIVPLARQLADILDRHLDLEEERLVPVMARGSGPGPQRPTGDPFGGIDPAFALPWLADGLPDAVVTALLAALPTDLQAPFPDWRRSYDAWWPAPVPATRRGAANMPEAIADRRTSWRHWPTETDG